MLNCLNVSVKNTLSNPYIFYSLMDRKIYTIRSGVALSSETTIMTMYEGITWILYDNTLGMDWTEDMLYTGHPTELRPMLPSHTRCAKLCRLDAKSVIRSEKVNDVMGKAIIWSG